MAPRGFDPATPGLLCDFHEARENLFSHKSPVLYQTELRSHPLDYLFSPNHKSMASEEPLLKLKEINL